MRKVMQTITGFGGNCESACIATLLGKTIDEVPSFWEGIDVENTDPTCPIAGATYQKNLNNYLLSQGYRSISLGENRPQEWSKEWVCSISKGLVDTPTARAFFVHAIAKILRYFFDNYAVFI